MNGSRSRLETWNWKIEIWETCLRAGTHRQGWNELCYVAQRWCIKCTQHAVVRFELWPMSYRLWAIYLSQTRQIQSNSWKTRPRIECVHQQYKSMKAQFPISIFQFQRSVNAYDECNVQTPVNKGPAGKELTCIDSEKEGHACPVRELWQGRRCRRLNWTA